jgi:hypothetical protein
MQKNFKVGDKVKVVVEELHRRIGQVGVVATIVKDQDISQNSIFYLKFPDSTGHLVFFEHELEHVQESTNKKTNKKPKATTLDSLTQVIVNTSGKARLVTQERDSLGRFVKGAAVSTLDNTGHVLRRTDKAKNLVLVQHSYDGKTQTVTAVNRETGKGNAVVFTNDGLGTLQHDSLFS